MAELDSCARETSGRTHSARSSLWLKKLGDELLKLSRQTHLNAQLGMRPTMDAHQNRKDSEFLFDIVVHASTKGRYTGERLWAVESEFERTNEAVGRDLAKLFWADVDNRLFIYSAPNTSFKDRLIVLSDCRDWEPLRRGALFACCVPHPGVWERGLTTNIDLKEYSQSQWIDVLSAG